MNVADATPAEIDTELARNYHLQDSARAEIDRANAVIERIDGAAGYEADLPWNSPERRAEAVAAVHAAAADLRGHSAAAAPLEARYADERWTRYYLVTNTGGHVHKSTHCDTCFATTRYAWLTEQSGMTPEALVDLAGEAACTVCFPWAPVDTLNRPTRLEAPERKAAREAREAEKAERLAKKVAKGLTTDGSEFQVAWYADDYRYQRPAPGAPAERRLVHDAKHTETFKTERAATQWYVAQHADNTTWERPAADLQVKRPAFDAIEAAVAAKHGQTVEQVRADLQRKIDAKVKRDRKEADATARRLGL
jgi:hypothetical protein